MPDTDEAGEEELADQELRAENSQGNEDLHEALQADLTDIHPSTHSPLMNQVKVTKMSRKQLERNEDLSSENDADRTTSVLETDLEDEELADEISNESGIETEEEGEYEEQERDSEPTEYTIKGDVDNSVEDVQNDGQEDGEYDYEEEEDAVRRGTKRMTKTGRR